MITSSDHDEPAQPEIETINNGRATILQNRGLRDALKQNRSSKDQRGCIQKTEVQPYRISKPSTSHRREAKSTMQERQSKGLKPKACIKSYRTATVPAAGRASVPEIVDLCSTDSESVVL
ncbi:hypothetical protein CLAFUW4_01860 [Fulvia fulva]|uniref:Uncharacterized protein n=1 Tax=Passalora fulva TaxID=5499 RepID=A0A9Q8P2T2_PASFU|nr:uncharacterized protein CLAFUR5_01855 [Fulvia fulva]KAK4635686.1 hypothetical protein CLAFUR4_01855 [Fulvia fulva]KAK4636813.1 hypothetical protein CLAFUR0_01857 [Fulvia fulva]UJO10997.1 hypothetical protein CLAFUR5_01855 [Fulvia fulva]WPV09801.1 hypothetical protein CLAFUW4_01860 [Fulvia fulva]WPV24106.1 hypothetical protein CLAFUW7_01859 [Fulvia fulva]